MHAAFQSSSAAAEGPACFTTPESRSLVTLGAAFQDTRDFTMHWAAMLTPEDMMVQSCEEASPVKWHLAHTTWFFETFLLREFLPDYRPLNDDYRWLFNSYYNAVSEQPDKASRAGFSRPSIQQVIDYRKHVDAAMATLIEMLEALPAGEARRRIVLGIQHEQQHQELIAYDIKNAFWSNPLNPALRALPGIPPPPPGHPMRFRKHAQGLVEVGADQGPSQEAFVWDNEQPRHKFFVDDFELATSLVNCGEYAQFVADGGYQTPSLWLSAGWDTVQQQGWKAPQYWRLQDGAWNVFTLHGMLPLTDLLQTPVCHVSHYEADAFARWAGCRLPSEFEWETAAEEHTPANGGLLTSSSLKHGFLHPSGHNSLFGDAWQWTQSAYTPYPGYQAPSGALGEYNGKFMSGQMVLRGGSVVTPYGHMRATYRNFFAAHTRWQFAGIRLAKDGI